MADLEGGGYSADNAEVYDIDTEQWDVVPNPGLGGGFLRFATQAAMSGVSVAGKIYVVGGWTASPPTPNAPANVYDYLQIYDPSWTSAWSYVAPMSANGSPVVTFWAPMAALGGKIYVLGIYGTPKNSTGVCIAYDPIKDSWGVMSTPPADLPKTYEFENGVALGGKFWCFGWGRWVAGTEIWSAAVYDPITNNWSPDPSKMAPMNNIRIRPGVAALGGKIYAVGGFRSGGETSASTCTDGTTSDDCSWYYTSAEVYDPIDNSWNYIASMGTLRAECGLAALGGKLYAVGGQTPSIPSSNGTTGIELIATASAEVYDPNTNSWSYIASMNAPRAGLSVVALGGKLYATGGAALDMPASTGATHRPGRL